MLDRTQMASRTSERLGYESTNLIKNPRTKIWVNFFDCVAGLLPRNSSMGRETNGNRCVQCGFRTSQLFVLYSPGNMHLMKCVSLLQQNFFLTCPCMRSLNHCFFFFLYIKSLCFLMLIGQLQIRCGRIH